MKKMLALLLVVMMILSNLSNSAAYMGNTNPIF